MGNATVVNSINACLDVGKPVLLLGSPGGGKTSKVVEIARKRGMHIITVIGSVREASDFAGVPMRSEKGDYMFIAPPEWVMEACRIADSGQDVLVFLDELTTCPQSVQAAMLRIILDKVVADTKLPDNVYFIAAGNPPDEAADGHDLAPPLANRFAHFMWEPDIDEWCEGITGGWRKLVTPQEIKWFSLGTTYIRRNRAAFRPTRGFSGAAFPSARSWDNTLTTIAKADENGYDADTIREITQGFLGMEVAAGFMAFTKSLDLPDTEKLLGNPWNEPMPVNKPDVMYVTVASVASAVLANPTPERFKAAVTVFMRLSEASQVDLVIDGFRKLVHLRLQNAGDPAWDISQEEEARYNQKSIESLRDIEKLVGMGNWK